MNHLSFGGMAILNDRQSVHIFIDTGGSEEKQESEGQDTDSINI